MRSGHARSSDESSMDVWICTVKYNYRESKLRERGDDGGEQKRGEGTPQREGALILDGGDEMALIRD